jgi:hypothetical protein
LFVIAENELGGGYIQGERKGLCFLSLILADLGGLAGKMGNNIFVEG